MKKTTLTQKIISYQQFSKNPLQYFDPKIVLVGGCFDIFHFGHLTFLQKAKQLGDKLVVLLESDDFIKLHKKRIPIHTQLQRAKILASLIFVDLIICLPLFDKDQEYEDLVSQIRPKVIAVTKDDPNIKLKKTQAKQNNSKVIVATTSLKGFSTREIIAFQKKPLS